MKRDNMFLGITCFGSGMVFAFVSGIATAHGDVKMSWIWLIAAVVSVTIGAVQIFIAGRMSVTSSEEAPEFT